MTWRALARQQWRHDDIPEAVPSSSNTAQDYVCQLIPQSASIEFRVGKLNPRCIQLTKFSKTCCNCHTRRLSWRTSVPLNSGLKVSRDVGHACTPKSRESKSVMNGIGVPDVNKAGTQRQRLRCCGYMQSAELGGTGQNWVKKAHGGIRREGERVS